MWSGSYVPLHDMPLQVFPSRTLCTLQSSKGSHKRWLSCMGRLYSSHSSEQDLICTLQVLQRRLKRITDDLKRALVTEVEALLQHGLPQPSAAGGWSDLMQVFPSANLLLDELEVSHSQAHLFL